MPADFFLDRGSTRSFFIDQGSAPLTQFPVEASSVPSTRSVMAGVPALPTVFPAEVPADACSVPATRSDLADIPTTKYFPTGAVIQGVVKEGCLLFFDI